MPRDPAAQLEDIARVAVAMAPLVPEGVALLREIIQGHSDPRVQRVADLLPEKSLSELAARRIEAGGG